MILDMAAVAKKAAEAGPALPTLDMSTLDNVLVGAKKK